MGSSSRDSSSSRPLTGAERSDIFRYGMGDITRNATNPALQIDYNAPEFQAASPYQTLSGGDYDAFQKSIYDSSTAGLSQFEKEARMDADQAVADRGLWASGVALANQNDITDSLADTYAKAGADAAVTRYGMQAQDLAGLNAWNQQDAAMRNNMAMENANRQYASQWAPLDYLSGVWNGTGGVIQSGKSSGWGIL